MATRKKCSCSFQNSPVRAELGSLKSMLTVWIQGTSRSKDSDKKPPVSRRNRCRGETEGSHLSRKSACCRGSPPVRLVMGFEKWSVHSVILASVTGLGLSSQSPEKGVFSTR